jgi:F0F1-type ATP synthase assembly protein I
MAGQGTDGQPGRNDRRPLPVGAMTLASGGLEFAVAILLGVFGGQWLDRRLGTGPWLVIVGAFVGAAAGFYNLYRTITTAQDRASSQGHKSDGGGGAT